MASDPRRPPGFDELRLPARADEELEPTELGRPSELEPTETLRPGLRPDPTSEEATVLGPGLRLDALPLDAPTAELPTLELDTEERPHPAPWIPEPDEPAAPAARPAAGPSAEEPWRSLHPASLLINVVPQTARVLFGFWPLLLAAALGGRQVGLGLEDGFFLVLILGSGGLSTLVHYLTLRYRVAGGRLEIRQGLLNRQARVIDPARIQNVSLVRNPFHRLAGLVEVRLETAGDLHTEGLLSALSLEEAERLTAALSQRGHAPGAAPPAEGPPMLQNSALELLALGLSRPHLGAIFLAWIVGSELLAVVGPGQADVVAELLTPARALALGLLAFGLAWVGQGLLSVVRHFGFELRPVVGADGRPRLRGQQGLFTRTVVEVPLRKVQLVGAEEPWLRRAMGYGTVSVQTAASGVPGDATAAELLVPMVEQERLGALFAAAIPGALDPWAEPLEPPPPEVLRRALVGAALRAGVLAAALGAAWGPLALLGLGVLPVLALGAWLDVRAQGWRLSPALLVGREGFWRRTTWMLDRDKVQSVHLSQGPLLRRWGLSRVLVNTAGTRVALPLLRSADAEALQHALTVARGA